MRANGAAVQSAVVPSRRTGIIVIAAMLAASGLAFLRAEQLKLERSPVGSTHLQKYFSTTCTPLHPRTRCRSHSALLRFRLRKAGRVALAIVSTSGATIDRLTPAAGRRLPQGPVAMRWDGRTDAGAQAPQGTYHLRVHLLSLGRTITIPDPIELDLTAPAVTLLSRPARSPSATARASRRSSSCGRRGRARTRAAPRSSAAGRGSSTSTTRKLAGAAGAVHARRRRPGGNASAPSGREPPPAGVTESAAMTDRAAAQ